LNGHDILPMEGRSLSPAFDDKPIDRDAIFWEHEGNAAVRVGDWKLVRVGNKGEWELHNMVTHRTELHDSSKDEPKIAADLLATPWFACMMRICRRAAGRGAGRVRLRCGRLRRRRRDGEPLRRTAACFGRPR
jgi:arylsulfatase A-like enzyme